MLPSSGHQTTAQSAVQFWLFPPEFFFVFFVKPSLSWCLCHVFIITIFLFTEHLESNGTSVDYIYIYITHILFRSGHVTVLRHVQVIVIHLSWTFLFSSDCWSHGPQRAYSTAYRISLSKGINQSINQETGPKDFPKHSPKQETLNLYTSLTSAPWWRL